jgi:hypothetical protein
MDGLTEGRMVHYVLPDGPGAGEHRAALVVRVWRSNGAPPENGCANLQVFMDGTNDAPAGGSARWVEWRTSVVHDPDGAPGTWHWIERA